jgi:hypothetical protein
MFASRRRELTKEMLAEHINLKSKYESIIKLGLFMYRYPTKPSAGLFILIKSFESIPLSNLNKVFGQIITVNKYLVAWVFHLVSHPPECGLSL